MNQLFFETFDLFSKNLDDTYNKYIDIVDPIIDDTIINTRPNSNSTEEIVISNEDQKEIEYKEEKKEIQTPKRGRKLKNDNNIYSNTHSRLSEDNLSYRIKNNSINCLISSINKAFFHKKNRKKRKYKRKIMKIQGDILRNSKRDFNIILLNKKIENILKLPKSRKLTKNPYSNSEIISEIRKKNKKISEILDMTFIDFINNIYMKFTSSDFKKHYGFKNKFLFKENKKFDSELKNAMTNFVEKGILNYYQIKKTRNRNNNVNINN